MSKFAELAGHQEVKSLTWKTVAGFDLSILDRSDEATFFPTFVLICSQLQERKLSRENLKTIFQQ